MSESWGVQISQEKSLQLLETSCTTGRILHTHPDDLKRKISYLKFLSFLLPPLLCALHSGLIHQIVCSTYNVHATLILTHYFTALPPPTTSPHWPHISWLCPRVANSTFVSAANKTTSKSNHITTNNKGTGWSYGLDWMNSGTSDNKTNSLHGPKCEMWRWWYRSQMYGLFLPLVDSPHKLCSRLSASISMCEMTTESMMYYPGENLELLMQQANQKKSIYSLHFSYPLLLTFTTDHLIPILSRYVHPTHNSLFCRQNSSLPSPLTN